MGSKRGRVEGPAPTTKAGRDLVTDTPEDPGHMAERVVRIEKEAAAMSTEREPRTEAGRALLNTGDYIGPNFSHALAASILDIEAEAAREALERVRRAVDEQAEDEGLWFVAQTAPEAYLQQELRRLHAAIEETP